MMMSLYFGAGYRAAQPEAVAAARARMLRTDAAGYVACCHAVANVNWLERLSELRCPTLVISGALDQGAPVALSEAMAERIPGAELLVFDQAAHLSVAEQPVRFAQALQTFITRVG